MHSIIKAPLCAILAAAACLAAAQTPGPSVRDVVEFEQIVQPEDRNDDLLGEQVSPDGTQAFIVTRKSDVASDKNRYEIQLLDVRPDHLATQRSPRPAVVFSAAFAQDNDPNAPGIQDVRWMDDRTLVFLARLDGSSHQVFRLDVPRRELTQLTHDKDRIVSYAVSRDLRRVVCIVQVPNPPLHEGEHGVVVGTHSFWSLMFGQNNLLMQERLYQYVVSDVGSSKGRRTLGDPFIEGDGAQLTADISPDGRWALAQHYEPERIADWASRYPMIGEVTDELAQSFHTDPLQYFSRPLAVVPRRTTVWRLDDGKEQAIVDAPDDVYRAASDRGERLWQGTGTSVVLAGTYLPPAPDGTTSPRSHLVEYWPDAGRWMDIAALDGHMMEAHPLRDGFVVLDGTRRREFHRQAEGGWRESTGDARERAPDPGWTLHVVEGLNQPPDVFASAPSGKTTRLTALNPQFDPGTWGDMRPFTWRDGAGRHWDGGLMSHGSPDADAPLPLLIQTYGFSAKRFYLDGPNDGEGYTSAFAGRAFLREGMLVLAMPWNPEEPIPSGHEALAVFNDGVRSAIDALVKQGRVDPARVGIMGWSATGERVLNLLTSGDVPIRSATTADGDEASLWTYAITYGAVDTLWWRFENVNQGLPFGKSQAAWLRNDPALHTDCIRTPLRIETYGPAVKTNWDVYALLRRQYKPVEMIIVPGGAHSLQTPGDRMVSLQGNVDWHTFWLTGKTRTALVMPFETSKSLAAQTSRWRQMERLKPTNDAGSRCVG